MDLKARIWLAKTCKRVFDIHEASYDATEHGRYTKPWLQCYAEAGIPEHDPIYIVLDLMVTLGYADLWDFVNVYIDMEETQ